MKKLSSNCLRFFFIIILHLLVFNLAFGQQTPAKPFTKDELVDLCRRPALKQSPNVILTVIRKNKIAFLPTNKVIESLLKDSVPKLITDELKYNFACRLVYRVCKFEPVDGIGNEFTTTLNNAVEATRLTAQAKGVNGLLRDKVFDPIPSGPAGPGKEELNEHPALGYLLIMGDIKKQPGSQNMIVTAHLVFISKVQVRMDIAFVQKTMSNTTDSKQKIANEIARWSIEELERQIK